MSDVVITSILQIGTTRHTGSISYTQSNAGYQSGSKAVGTSEESVTIDADLVATPRAMYIANTDATNFVEVGTSTGVYPLKLLAGDEYVVPIHSGTATIFLKADTATCEVEYVIVEA